MECRDIESNARSDCSGLSDTRPVKYRHAYHAGNFADAFKHVALLEVLKALTRKPAPFFYLETHAGRGEYPLDGAAMPAGSEYRRGVGRLLQLEQGARGPLGEYLDLVQRLGKGTAATQPKRYPGSPGLVAALLRASDRAVFFEIVPAEAQALARLLRSHRNVAVRCADGYAALRAVLPPRERRGLVFIDPPYERQEAEFGVVLAGLREALSRWSSGTYAIWYPIKRRAPVARFHERLVASGWHKVLCAELCLYPDDSRVGLNGCGMIIVNPPWRIERALGGVLPALHRALAGQPGTGVRCEWLVGERATSRARGTRRGESSRADGR